MRGRYTDLNLWFYVNVCLDADANVITGVGCGDLITLG